MGNILKKVVLVMVALFLSFTGVSLGEEYNGFTDSEEIAQVYDPLEPVNRVFFTFNDRLYFWFLKPVATIYKAFIPTGVRQGISNSFNNLRMPARFFNNLFQGKPENALVELQRFVINSTLGVGGFFDVAERHFNLSSSPEDFGQTLAVHGVKEGPFINWPFFGPSTLRDSIGTAVDMVFDPLTYIVPNFITNVEVKAGEKTNQLSLRVGEYEDLKKSAIDPYLAVRDAYIQYRNNLIAK